MKKDSLYDFVASTMGKGILMVAVCMLFAVTLSAQTYQAQVDTIWGRNCMQETDGHPTTSVMDLKSFENEVQRDTLAYYNIENGNTHLLYYIHIPAGHSRCDIVLSTKSQKTVDIVFTLSDAQTGAVLQQRTVAATKKGHLQRVELMADYNFDHDGWYKLDLSAENLRSNIRGIRYLLFQRTSTDIITTPRIYSSLATYLNGWQSTDPDAPSAESYDMCYVEVFTPQDKDVLSTYYSTMNLLGGYMGIQTAIDGSDTWQNLQHNVLFSMWDNGNTDEDPYLPDYLKSGALDKGSYDGTNVWINRFGGEGTGVQAFLKDGHYWQPGHWVQMLVTARPEDVEVEITNSSGNPETIIYHNTLVTAWWKQDSHDEWHYIATLRKSGVSNYFDGWYSFLENWNPWGGNRTRHMYMRNGYMHSLASGKWYHRNKITSGYYYDPTRLYPNQRDRRLDFDFGISEEAGTEGAFYMKSGGYFTMNNGNEVTLTVPLNNNGLAVDTIDTERLLHRVNQAILKDKNNEMTAKISAATTLAAKKQLAQSLLDKAGQFNGYRDEDLANLRAVYNNGNVSDESALRNALTTLGRTATPLKYGYVERKANIGSYRAYQLYNTSGGGVVTATTSGLSATSATATGATAAAREILPVTDMNTNWQLLRYEEDDTYYLYNLGQQKYLDLSKTTLLSNTPVQVTVTKVTGGFTFSQKGKYLVTAPTASPSVTSSTSSTNAVFELRDNYYATPTKAETDDQLSNVEASQNPYATSVISGNYYRIVSANTGFSTQGKYVMYIASDGTVGWRAYDSTKEGEQVFRLVFDENRVFGGNPYSHAGYTMQAIGNDYYICSDGNQMGGYAASSTTEKTIYLTPTVPEGMQFILQPEYAHHSSAAQCLRIDDQTKTSGRISKGEWTDWNGQGTMTYTTDSPRCWYLEKVTRSVYQPILDAKDPLVIALDTYADAYSNLTLTDVPGYPTRSNVTAFKNAYRTANAAYNNGNNNLTNEEKQTYANNIVSAYNTAVGSCNPITDGYYRVVSTSSNFAGGTYAMYLDSQGNIGWKPYSATDAHQIFEMKYMSDIYFDNQSHREFSMRVGNYYIGKSTKMMGGVPQSTTEAYPVATTITTPYSGQIVFQPQWEPGYVSQCMNVNNPSATSGTIVQNNWLSYDASHDNRTWRLEPVSVTERLQAIIATASSACTGYDANTPAADQESHYYTIGTECGYTTTTTQIDALTEAIQTAQSLGANASDADKQEQVEAVWEAYNICEARQDLPEDGGYYYIIHGYADDSNREGVAFAMCNNSATSDGRVYKKALNSEDVNYVFKLTAHNGNWYIQNVATGKYFGAYSDGVQLVESPVDQVLDPVYINHRDRWTPEGSIKQRIRWDLYNTTDGTSKKYYAPGISKDGQVKITDTNDGSGWWMHGWMLRPVEDAVLEIPEISVTAAGFSTYYSAMPTKVGSGFTAYYVSGVSNGKVIFTPFPENVIPANTGAVIKGAEGAGIDLTGQYVVDFNGTNLMLGTITDQTITADDNYYYFILGRKKDNQGNYNYGFYMPNGITANGYFTNHAHKAYVRVLKTELDGESAAKGLGVQWDDDPTGIEMQTSGTRLQEDQMFNLQGQRVGPNYRGIVIVKGKTVLKR